MTDAQDPLEWLLGPGVSALAPAAAPAAQGDDDGGFAAWLAAAAGVPEPDEWERLGLEGLALEAARLWARDLHLFTQPGAPGWQQMIARTLEQLLQEVSADPKAFNQRAASVS